MAINWNDQDILLMGSNLGKQLRHYRKGDVDEVTLNKLAIWFMDNFDELYAIYNDSEQLLNFMNYDDSDFLANIESGDGSPSYKIYEKSLGLKSPYEFLQSHYRGRQVESYDAFRDFAEDQWLSILSHMDKFNRRIKNILASGLWVKPNPLAQGLWSLRTFCLMLFAMMRFAIWWYPTKLLISKQEVSVGQSYYYTYQSIAEEFVDDWFEQLSDLDPMEDLLDYTKDWKDVDRLKLYRQWGVDPQLLEEQRAFITSLALLIRRGLSDRDRKATTFSDERYNTANELKELVQLGWSPKLPSEIDVQECPKCDGKGYRGGQQNSKGRIKKRKCTTCQGWGNIGEHIWLYRKRLNTGRYSQKPSIRKWDVGNENKRHRFDRLVSTFKSECVGNYK